MMMTFQYSGLCWLIGVYEDKSYMEVSLDWNAQFRDYAFQTRNNLPVFSYSCGPSSPL